MTTPHTAHRDRPGRADVYAAPIEPATDQDVLLALNRRFYEAFEARDLDGMSEIWDHGDDVVCTHPGWTTLHGWAAVAASWFALFQGPVNQFILTNEVVAVAGDAGWVSVDENVIAERSGGGTVAALNLFVRRDDGWRMVAHHGSSVVPQ